jgi:ribokinase
MTPIPAADGVAVVGSLTVDLTSFSDRLPALGETVLGRQFTMVAGGKGANQALAAARMGAPTWMVGCVGDDVFSATVTDGLAAGGVNAEYVRAVPGAATGIAHIRVDGQGDNDIVMIPLANGDLRTGDVDAALAGLDGRVGVVLVQLEIPADVAVHALRAAHARGITTVLDPAPAPREPLPADVYGLIDVVTPNETEASLLTGVTVVDEDSAQRAGEWFTGQGCGAAVITLGAAGAVLVRHGKPAQVIPPVAVAAVDSTAAGDAFTGALGSRLAATDGLEAALRWAAAAGALATTVGGASSSIPDHDAVRRLLDTQTAGRTEHIS